MARWVEKLWRRAGDLRLALLCGLILLALQHTPLLERSQWFAFDRMSQWSAWSRPLDSSLALVAIDDGSIQELAAAKSWPWPWPRGAYADIITYLKACGAREVWIDLTFETPDADTFQDDELRAVIAAAGNVHVGRKRNSTAIFSPNFNVTLPNLSPNEAVIHGDIDGQHLLAWPRPFNELIKLRGQTQITPAAPLVGDGEMMLRRVPADDRSDPAKVAAAWTNVPVPALAGRFKDKIVYLGVTANAGYDLKAFPVGTSEPSVMIHLVSRSNAVTDGYFWALPNWLRNVIALLLCVVVGDVFRRMGNFERYTLTMVAMIAAIALASYALFLGRIWVQPMIYFLAVVVTFTVITSSNYVREGRKRRMTEDLFGKFVSRKIVDRLVARPDQLRLGGEKAELTVLFSDLSGFTTLSEAMPSDVLLRFLNTYLNEMSELIYERDGTLDKYIGDAIMAFWGAPDVSPDHAWKACQAALACQKRLAEMAPQWEEVYGARLVARIGINTDEMTVGLVGSNRLHNYSVIGDAVNFASRLEGASKPFGTSILIAQRTLDLAQGKIEVRPVARLQVKGKTKPVMVYELLAMAGELDAAGQAVQRNFTAAFEAFLRRDWTEAERCLKVVLGTQPKDPLAGIYLERVREFAATPPPAGWDGVFKLDEK